MEEEEIKKLEKEQMDTAKKYEIDEAHAKRILAISSLLSKPKRFKRCPKCKRRLEERNYHQCTYYKCVCGYEYATAAVDSRG